MSSPKPIPSPDPNSQAFRDHVVQRIIREKVSVGAVAREYGLKTKEVAAWKKEFLERLKTATKGNQARKSVASGTEGPVVQDLSRQPVKQEDSKKTGDPLVPFPTQSSAPLTPEEREKLEKTQRLILEEGKVTVDVGRKMGMMPKASYDQRDPTDIGSDEVSTHEIPNESKERFAKNWERAGASAPPLSVPPEAPKLTFHERLLPKLQAIPGISWMLRGGRFDSAPWVIIIIGLAIIGAVFFLVVDRNKGIPGEELAKTPITFRPLTRTDIDVAKQLISTFFAAKSVEQMLPYVRASDTMQPVMERYYQTNKLKPQKIYSFEEHRREEFHGKPFTVHGVRFTQFSPIDEIYIEHTPEGGKIDWELAVGYQSVKWSTYRYQKPPELTYLRLKLTPSRYYEKPFHDPSVYRAFRISHPDEVSVINGFVMIDTEAETTLREMMPDEESTAQVLAGLKYPPNAKNDKLVEIMEIFTPGWVVDYEPGQAHFDLKSPVPGAAVSVEDEAPAP